MTVRIPTPQERLAAVELFGDCSRRELAMIDGLLTTVGLPAGRSACLQGEFGRQFFVVRDGTFAVTRDGDPIAMLGAGDWFGEIALSRRCTRTATVTSASPATLLVFSSREYASMRAACPKIATGIDAAMQDRLEALGAGAGAATGVLLPL